MATVTLTSSEDGEIGVFGAEKYFNGGIDLDSPRSITSKIDHAKKLEYVRDGAIKLEPIKPAIIHQQKTPSVRSDQSSSWNSQTALLQTTVMRNPPKPKPNKSTNAKSFLSNLAGCNCYCSDKNSVEIEEVQVGEISFKRPAKSAAASCKASLEVKKPSSDQPWNKDVDIFTFPTMNSVVGIRPVKVLQGDEDEIGRKSLEVFGSPVVGRRNKSINLERRLKMLSWDQTTPQKPDNDTESDASSDLFEIESLTSGKANPFLARQPSDAAASGCVTPTTCYAPSEASIEWSVVTASAADFSVISDYEEQRPSTTTLPSPIKTFPVSNVAKAKNNKESHHQRQRSSGLLGCNSQKAVKVAGDAHKSNEKLQQAAGNFDSRMRRVSDSYMPATRFRAENKLTGGFGPAQTPRILATRSLPLPHSHSPQASHLLYIQ